jgi:RNA polymerase sigma-70 factor (ECF subfamily)
MHDTQPNTDQLLNLASEGDGSATQQLLDRYRPRLRGMIAVHLDQRISTRVDPSDVVQEALVEAFEKLPGYAKERTISFYPWLRQIAWQRLVKLHQRHITASRRTVEREDQAELPLPEDSVMQLADRIASSGTEPGQAFIKQEIKERVRTGLSELRHADRQVLVMRFLEHLSIKEISETLEVNQETIKKRYTRALERLGQILGDTP